MTADSTDRIANVEVQVIRHLIYNNKESRKQAKRLHGVRPYKCLDTSLPGVKPYQQHQ